MAFKKRIGIRGIVMDDGSFEYNGNEMSGEALTAEEVERIPDTTDEITPDVVDFVNDPKIMPENTEHGQWNDEG
jgi:hypothetical protein